MLAFFSFLAWAIVAMLYFAFVTDNSEEKKKAKREDINVGDVVAAPGMLVLALLPIIVLVGFVCLLAAPFR